MFPAERQSQNQIRVECPDDISSSAEALLTTDISGQAESDLKSLEEFLAVETFTNPLAEDEGDFEQEEVKAAPTLVVDPDLELKVRRACERISENVHICANEPSLAFFRLSEHVRKALPPTVESRHQVHTIQRQLGAAYEDADVALQ